SSSPIKPQLPVSDSGPLRRRPRPLWKPQRLPNFLEVTAAASNVAAAIRFALINRAAGAVSLSRPQKKPPAASRFFSLSLDFRASLQPPTPFPFFLPLFSPQPKPSSPLP
ncbi:hypothetical protein LINPERHAP2_LOCUS40206, partial [Linum perenne]